MSTWEELFDEVINLLDIPFRFKTRDRRESGVINLKVF